MNNRIGSASPSPRRHPSRDQILAFADGQPLANEEDLLLHFVVCDECRAVVEERRRTSGAARLVRIDPVQEDVDRKRVAALLMAKIEAGGGAVADDVNESDLLGARRSRAPSVRTVGIAAGLAASILLFVFTRASLRDRASANAFASRPVGRDTAVVATQAPTSAAPKPGIAEPVVEPPLPIAENRAVPAANLVDTTSSNVAVATVSPIDRDTVARNAVNTVLVTRPGAKPTIAVYPFVSATTVRASDSGLVAATAQRIVGGMVAGGHFQVRDQTMNATLSAALSAPLRRQRESDALSLSFLTERRERERIGILQFNRSASLLVPNERATYVLLGYVNSVDVVPIGVDSAGRRVYRANVNATLSIVDGESAAVVGSRRFIVHGSVEETRRRPCVGSFVCGETASNKVKSAGRAFSGVVRGLDSSGVDAQAGALVAAIDVMSDSVVTFANAILATRPTQTTRVASSRVRPRVVIVPVAGATEDIVTLIERDSVVRRAVNTATVVFDRAGFETIDVMRDARQLASSEPSSTSDRVRGGGGFVGAMKSIGDRLEIRPNRTARVLRRYSSPDFYVEVDMRRGRDSLVATSYLALNDRVLAKSDPGGGLDSLLAATQRAFDGLVEDGLPVHLDVSVARDAPSLARTVGSRNETLDDVIEHWLNANTVKSVYDIASRSPTQLAAADVRIPIVDAATGVRSDPADFGKRLSMYLNRLGVIAVPLVSGAVIRLEIH